MPPGFDKFESFGYDEFTAKHCYFKCSRPANVDGIKIFDKDDWATNTFVTEFAKTFCLGTIYTVCFFRT